MLPVSGSKVSITDPAPIQPTNVMFLRNYEIDNNIQINIPKAYLVCQLNDSQLAFGTTDGEITIFNIQTKEHLIIIKAHRDCILSLLPLSDGRLVTGSSDRLIKIWNLTTQTCEITLTGHENTVSSLCELSDGRLVSGSSDKSIKVWNLHSGNCEKTLFGHKNVVTSIIRLSNNDNTMIASASHDNTIRIWNVETNSCIRVIEEAGPVMIQLSDNRLASTWEDANIKIWNYLSGTCEQQITNDEAIECLLQLSDGHLVSGSYSCLKIWNISNQISNNHHGDDNLLQTLYYEEKTDYCSSVMEMNDHRILLVRVGYAGESSLQTIWKYNESQGR